jgi:hypothetical protein
MASIISAGTTAGTALNLSGDTTGILQLATGATPTTAVTIDASQNTTLAGTIRMASYLVAGLPVAGTAGRRAYVTNALAPTFLATVVGGGAVVVPVFDNGVNWIIG